MLIKYFVLKKSPNLKQWRAEKGLSAIKVIFKCNKHPVCFYKITKIFIFIN